MKRSKPIRVLLAKPGLCTHESGVKLLAAGLRDAGMEVIYTGVFQTTEAITQTAMEEDVDIVGLSFLNGGHVQLTEAVVNALNEAGLGSKPVIVGGIIPEVDLPLLRDAGAKGIYAPGTTVATIAEDIVKLLQ